MDKVFVFGTGKTAIEFLYQNYGRVEVQGFIDNNPDAKSPIKGVRVFTYLEWEKNGKIIVCTNQENFNSIRKQLENAGLSEWSDYIYYLFYKKKVLLLIGNCHIKVIKDMLMLNSDFNSKYGIYALPAICEIDQDDKSEYLSILGRADVVVQQDIQGSNSLGYEFSVEFVHNNIKNECIHIQMLNTYGFGRLYYPFFDDDNPRNMVSSANPYGVFPVRDIRLDRYLDESFELSEVLSEMKRYNGYKYIVENKKQLFDKYYSREKTCHIKVMRFIEENYKKKLLFYDRAHPINDVIAYMVDQIFEYLGIECNNLDYSGLSSMSRFSLPIYDDVRNALGLEFSYDYLSTINRERLVRKRLDLCEYIREYLFYCGRNR